MLPWYICMHVWCNILQVPYARNNLPSTADLCQALHEKSAANSDHTTLLLNCYTKLKDIVQLDKFVSVRISLFAFC